MSSVNRVHAAAVAVAALAIAVGTSEAQEVSGAATTVAKPMSANLVPITGEMLQKAAADPKNWIHSYGN